MCGSEKNTIRMSGVLSSITEELFNEVMKGACVEFITEQNKILDALTHSKAHGTAVAITSPALGAGYYITAVCDIFLGEEDGDILIALKPYDITGYIFPRNKVYLFEIQSVCPFKSTFENPYFKSINNTNAQTRPEINP
jgi:hypothetical protein